MARARDLGGVSSALIRPFTFEQASQNVEFAKRYKPPTEGERSELLARDKELAAKIGPRYEPVA
jgi:hypothetical protein